jgi:uncharacterized protein
MTNTILERPTVGPSSSQKPGPPAPVRRPAPRLISFTRRHPVLTYYILTFALSWGALLLVGGRDFLEGADWQTDPQFLPAILAMILGPAGAGLLLIGVFDGKAGYRELLARLLRWRLAMRWYAVALLTTPVVLGAVLFVLSRTSAVYLPAILTTSDRASLLLMALASPLLTLPEELGWTGFAIPRLRRRYGWLVAGLIVGVLWAPWHLLQIVWVSRTMTVPLPLELFLPLNFLAPTLLAYRVLMVWVYDRTESLLVAVLMHASYIACTLFMFQTYTTGAASLIFTWVFAGALCTLATAVVMADRRDVARRQRSASIPAL